MAKLTTKQINYASLTPKLQSLFDCVQVWRVSLEAALQRGDKATAEYIKTEIFKAEVEIGYYPLAVVDEVVARGERQ